MPRLSAVLLLLTSATFSLGACSGAPLPAPPGPAAPALCEAAHLERCEQRLLASLGEAGAPSPELAASYVAARAERAPDDPWVRLHRELSKDRGARPDTASTTVAIVAEGALPEAATRLGASARAIALPSLPKPASITDDELLLALAASAGYRHVIHLRGNAGPATQLFPRDPLAGFTAGLLPIVRDERSEARLADHLALAAAIQRALEQAGGFHYVEAAREADAITALVDRNDANSEAVLRGREALQVLSNAGLVLDPEGGSALKSSPPSVTEAPPPSPSDTPYGDLLRVFLAKEGRKEWERRGASVLRGVAPDRREDIASLYVRSRDCQAASRPPPMEGLRDLIFANRLANALIRDKATEAQGAAGGFLPLPEWLSRYEKELSILSAAKLEWSYAPSLLLQRGEAFGLSPAGTATYKRVSEIGLAHLAASRALQEKAPARYRPFSQLAYVYNPGVLGDAPLRDALIALTQATVQGKLAVAHDASGVFEGLLTGAFAGLSYPPALQQAHYLALQGAFAGKLQGDLGSKTGWGVAGLYLIDAVYRLIADQGPKLDRSSEQIARALGDPAIPLPSLAALATASVRYAALAADGKLDPELRKLDRFPPERRAARDALRSAIAGLGEPGEAPNNVLDDVTELGDGLIATLSAAAPARSAGAGAGGDKPSAKGTLAPAASCSGKATFTLTPGTRRALGKLGDVRQRILSHPRFKTGDGRWVRRVRLLVTLLSDAMDVALKEQKRLTFTIPAAEAEANAAGALREWEAREAADAVAGLYALARGIGTAESAEKFLEKNGAPIRRVLAGLLAYFGDDPSAEGKRGPLLGVALLDAVAKLGLGKSGEGDLRAMLLSYAKAFYAQGKRDQADLWLLGSILISAVTDAAPSKEAIELAAENQSRIEWALRFLAEVNRGHGGEPPNPAVYAEGMRKATDDACQAPNAEDTLATMGALHAFAQGKRSEARQTLDRVLDKADREGLGVPRMTYRYEEKTATRVFTLTLEVSYGAGVLSNANTFQVGLGLRSRGEPEGSLSASLSPTDTAKAGEEAARYYVHTAALATIVHLLENDVDRATASARRVIGTLTSGARLGNRLLRSDKPASFGADSRALLAVAAVLAADQGLPFLAGDLWTVLRQGLGAEMDDAAIKAILDPLPLGLGSPKELAPAIERARKALRIVAEPLACTKAKVDLGGLEEPSCEAYPLALSLRIADVLKKLPRLRRGADGGATCAPLRSLDAFLASAEKGAYDPDAFTRAFEDLRASGRAYESAALLGRHRRDNHCSPAILGAARTLGRSATLGPLLRADLLSVAINCSISGGGAELTSDLLALDDETRKLPDPTRNLKVLLSVADLAVRSDQWGLLTTLAGQPELWERWMTVHPNAAAGALLIAHAVPAINGGAPDLEKTKSAYQLLCEIFPPGERAEICAEIKGLRAPLTGLPAGRQRAAKEAVRKVVQSFGGRP
jgi:hypothetical protein